MDFVPFNFKERQEEMIEPIMLFVYKSLCKWRDNSIRPNEDNEHQLNPDLPKLLTAYARLEFEIPLVFSHQEPQGKMRFIDLVVCFNMVECYNKAITVFECKRLTKDITGKRSDEYITGHKDITGGIQRFKLEAHGKEHKTVGMIGYVQTGICSEWQKTINSCIDNLCGKPDENGLHWSENEHLNVINHDEKNDKLYSKSLHPRITKPDITIHHLWVNMQKN